MECKYKELNKLNIPEQPVLKMFVTCSYRSLQQATLQELDKHGKKASQQTRKLDKAAALQPTPQLPQPHNRKDSASAPPLGLVAWAQGDLG